MTNVTVMDQQSLLWKLLHLFSGNTGALGGLSVTIEKGEMSVETPLDNRGGLKGISNSGLSQASICSWVNCSDQSNDGVCVVMVDLFCLLACSLSWSQSNMKVWVTGSRAASHTAMRYVGRNWKWAGNWWHSWWTQSRNKRNSGHRELLDDLESDPAGAVRVWCLENWNPRLIQFLRMSRSSPSLVLHSPDITMTSEDSRMESVLPSSSLITTVFPITRSSAACSASLRQAPIVLSQPALSRLEK